MSKSNFILLVTLFVCASVELGFGRSSESEESNEQNRLGYFNQSCIVGRRRTFCKDNLECKSNVCLCPSNSTWNGRYCERFGMTCVSNRECRAQKLACLNGICDCLLGSWNASLGICDYLPYNARCRLPDNSDSIESSEEKLITKDLCDSSANLECNGHRCVCKQEFTLTNGVCV